MKMVVCLMMVSMIAMNSYAKVPPVKEPLPIIRDGFIYEAKKGESGYIVKRNITTGKIEWTCQIYVVAYETQKGLSKCVQACPITQFTLSGDTLTVINQRGWIYELNLNDLSIVVKKGSRVVDYAKKPFRASCLSPESASPPQNARRPFPPYDHACSLRPHLSRTPIESSAKFDTFAPKLPRGSASNVLYCLS